MTSELRRWLTSWVEERLNAIRVAKHRGYSGPYWDAHDYGGWPYCGRGAINTGVSVRYYAPNVVRGSKHMPIEYRLPLHVLMMEPEEIAALDLTEYINDESLFSRRLKDAEEIYDAYERDSGHPPGPAAVLEARRQAASIVFRPGTTMARRSALREARRRAEENTHELRPSRWSREPTQPQENHEMTRPSNDPNGHSSHCIRDIAGYQVYACASLSPTKVPPLQQFLAALLDRDHPLYQERFADADEADKLHATALHLQALYVEMYRQNLTTT